MKFEGNTQNIIWGVVITVLIIGGLWIFWKTTTSPSASGSPEAAISIEADDNILGNENAPVTLIEYGEFQCPACAAYAPFIKQVLDNNDGNVRFIFRHYPLPQHQNAQIASYAAESAGNQGAFYEYYDILFANQEEWSEAENIEELLTSYAEELELDIEAFKADLSSEEVMQRIAQDTATGTQAGVNATPTFFINGEKIRNPNSLDGFQQLIDEALQEVGPVDASSQDATDSADTEAEITPAESLETDSEEVNE